MGAGPGEPVPAHLLTQGSSCLRVADRDPITAPRDLRIESSMRDIALDRCRLTVQRISKATAAGHPHLVPVAVAHQRPAGRKLERSRRAVAAMHHQFVARSRASACEPLQRQPAPHAEDGTDDFADTVRTEAELVPPPARNRPAPSAPPRERRSRNSNGNQLSSTSMSGKEPSTGGPTQSRPKSLPSRKLPADPPDHSPSIVRNASGFPAASVQDQSCVAIAESQPAPPR